MPQYDWEVSAGGKLPPHLLAVCLLLALGAQPPDVLSACPGLLPMQLNLLMLNKVILTAVADIKKQYLASDVESRLETLTPAVLAIYEKVILDKSGGFTLREQLQAGQFVWEQVKGKAKQKGDGSDETQLKDIYAMLDQVRIDRADGGPSQSVNLTAKTKKDPISDWVSQNITKETK